MRPFLLPLSLPLCLILSAPAQAAQTLDAAGFRAEVEGQTIWFAQDGTEYGAEYYIGRDRVWWSFLDGNCLTGRWFQDGDALCFLYNDSERPQCWRFSLGPGGLSAESTDAANPVTIRETRRSDEPLYCRGPAVGS